MRKKHIPQFNKFSNASKLAVQQVKPSAETFYRRGNELLASQDFEQALINYERALSIEPDFAKAHSNRGVVLQYLRRLDEALASYDRAIAIKPDYTDALYNRAIVLNAFNRFNEALSSYGQALAINPDYEFLFGTWLFMKMKLCEWSEFELHYNTLIARIEQGKKVSNPFFLQSISSSAAVQKKAAEVFVQRKCPSNFLAPPLVKHAHKRIKVAYFSSDFRNHPVSYLTAELFELHDASKFEVIAFSFSPVSSKDDMRLRLEAAFEQFIDVNQLSDEQVVHLARQLEIDIAVDLNGFTDGCRVNLFAMRLAPIQVNYLGYSGTMGADYMDYLLADSVLIPPAYQPYYAEKIAYLPNSYMVNDTKRLIAKKKFTRREFGLPKQGFVFCCFNNAYKITPQVFDVWMCLLQKIEGSVLWLSAGSPEVVKNLQGEATARGVNPERLIFAKRMDLLSEHLARHRLADLFLDTLPYNAHTTTSDALWAGLPVLTCIGEAFASRVAASLLTAIGLPELITTNHEDYEALAIQLATHPEQLATIKQKLADNRLTQPLFNTELFTQHIESAFQMMFERYQADLAPDYIYVTAQDLPLDNFPPKQNKTPSFLTTLLAKITGKHEKIKIPPTPKTKHPTSTALTQINILKFARAQQLQQQGQILAAEKLYDEILKTQPHHAEALLCVNEIKKQRELLPAVNSSASDAVDVLINQGNELEDLNRLEDALASYDCALTTNPNSARAHSNRGNVLQSLKRFDEALESYERALAIRPDYAEAFYNRGNTLLACQRFPEAIVSYNRALAIKPDFVQALISRGNALHNDNRATEALLSYQQALAIQPNSVEALSSCAIILQELERYDEARSHYERALAINPDLELTLGSWLFSQ